MDAKTIAKIAKEQADNIRAEMRGGTLYGQPIDIDNPDVVIYAAYLMGVKNSAREEHSDYGLVIAR